jgi:hypothetical protein
MDQADLQKWNAPAQCSHAVGDCSSLRRVIRNMRRADSWINFGFADYPGGWNRTKD